MGEPIREVAFDAARLDSPRVPATQTVSRTGSRFVKAVMDVVLGTVLALIALPVIAVLAGILAVRLKQWPFFGHQRMIHGGRLVTFPKLRTLPRSTPKYALKNGGEVVALDRFAAFLRHRHLDELPQLFLVPILRMSLVGPRPKMPDSFEPTDPGYRDARILVRQGCTGLWQIGHDQHRAIPHETPEYDFTYLQYGSLRMDLWILWRTGTMMLSGKTIKLADIPRWVQGAGWVPEKRICEAGGAGFMVTRVDGKVCADGA